MNVPAQKQSTEVSRPAANPFTAYGDQASQRNIVGTLLRFSKGDYLAGQDDDEVAIGTRFVANMDYLMVGWIRWENNKPTDHIMGKVVDNYQAPRRGELGDTDRTMWEVDSQGKERDPWQFSNYLLFKNVDDNELFTFASSSRGGLNALGDLSKAFGKVMSQHPEEWPIIELGVSSYNHQNKEFGRIKVPVLKIVGWAGKGGFEEAESGGGGGDDSDHDPETGEVKEKPAEQAAQQTAQQTAQAAKPAAPAAARPATSGAAKPRF